MSDRPASLRDRFAHALRQSHELRAERADLSRARRHMVMTFSKLRDQSVALTLRCRERRRELEDENSLPGR